LAVDKGKGTATKDPEGRGEMFLFTGVYESNYLLKAPNAFPKFLEGRIVWNSDFLEARR